MNLLTEAIAVLEESLDSAKNVDLPYAELYPELKSELQQYIGRIESALAIAVNIDEETYVRRLDNSSDGMKVEDVLLTIQI